MYFHFKGHLVPQAVAPFVQGSLYKIITTDGGKTIINLTIIIGPTPVKQVMGS